MIKFKDSDKFKFTKEFINSLPKIVDPITGCWLYQGYCLRGYGVITINYLDYYISRLSAVAYHNIDYYDINIEACHKPICPSKNCFNPDHIYPGTHSQNMKDKIATRTHQQHKKLNCPRCGGSWTIHTAKGGLMKGRKRRYCKPCFNLRRRRG